MDQGKRVISLALAIVMLCANCPISAFATTAQTTAEIHEHEDFQYSILSDGTISICGYDHAPENDMEGIYLEIPESINGVSVTQIADSAISDNNDIDTVVVPESIVSIGQSAFVDCADLKTIAFYGELPEFNSDVFDGCDNLKHLYVLSGTDVEVLGSEMADAGLNDVSVLEYEDLNALETAYQEYINTIDAELPADEQPTGTANAMTEDADESFETTVPNKTEDNAASLPEESTEHSNATESATEVIVPANQTESNDATNNVVAEISEVSEFTYTVLNGTYCEVTGYTGSDTEISIPSEIDGYIVQSIAGNAFSGNTTLTTVVLPETVETIGSYVFYGCTTLTDIRLNTWALKTGVSTFTAG